MASSGFPHQHDAFTPGALLLCLFWITITMKNKEENMAMNVKIKVNDLSLLVERQ